MGPIGYDIFELHIVGTSIVLDPEKHINAGKSI